MKNKKKILWFSLYPFREENMRSTGTWLGSMIQALLETDEVELYNVAFGNVEEPTRKDCKKVSQWIIPHEKINKKGLPSRKTINYIKKLEAEISPDLIHIWGTESYWGMLAAQKILSAPVLLDMQGIIVACAKVYYGGLTNKELIECIGLKEILLPIRHLYFRKRGFEKKGIHERYIIQNTPFISVQSEWVKTYIEHENPVCKIFPTGIMLRKEFYEAQPWTIENRENPVIFTSSSGSVSYKGLHVLFRAIAVLKQKFPTIQLRIAGIIQYAKYGYIRDGYSAWLLKEAKRLDIVDSIVWLGGLNAEEIVDQFHAASAVVIPSYVESYCLVLAEAMIVGVPTAVSYAGAMPELARHNESALYFPVGDYMSCACQIEKLLFNKALAEKLSKQAREEGLNRNNANKVVKRQLEIYNEVIDQTTGN
ncbi:MAG: glycosyltransferase family 4 protein [Bacteroidota bacterium]|nr:glycosyltransferase family 4 protein [Bacteroidota bacterium]